MPRVPFVLAGRPHGEEAGVAERPAQLPRPRQHRLRLVQPSPASSKATSSGSTTSSRRSPSSRTVSRRSIRRGSRASRSTASASTPPSTSTRRSSASGCRRCARPRGRPGSPTSRVFGEVTLNDAVDLSEYVRDRGLPQVLDFPFQQVASAYAVRRDRARRASRTASPTTTTSGRRTGVDPAFTDLPRQPRHGPRGAADPDAGAAASPAQSLVQHVLLGYDLLYLLRGAPACSTATRSG